MPSGYFHVNTVAFASNGKLVVAVRQVERNGTAYSVLRLNGDGSIDPSFNAERVAGEQIDALAIQQDGKVLVAGQFKQFAGEERAGIARLNANGSLDSTFAVTPDNSVLSNIVVQPDGKILFAGSFSFVNGVARDAVARLNVDGTVDSTFISRAWRSQLSGLQPIRGLALQPDGQILLAGRFEGLDFNTAGPVARLNPDGTLDRVFGARPRGSASMPTAAAYHIDLLPNGDIVAAGDRVYCFRPPTASPALFEAALFVPTFGSIAARPDGTLLVAPTFQISGNAEIVAFSATGARENIDLGQFGREVSADQLATRRDGEIWIGSESARTIDAVPTIGVSRLKPNGSVNLQFDAAAVSGLRALTGFALDATDKILLHNYLAFFSETPSDYLRLNADNSVDTSFQKDASNKLEFSHAIALADGKYLIFHALSPRAIMTDTVVRRLLPNGQLDESFDLAINFPEIAGNGVEIYAGDNRPLAFYPDGRFLLRYFDRTGNYHLRRFHSDGSLDQTFKAGSVPALQTVQGSETVVSDLSYDTYYVIRAPGTAITDAALLPDGKILLTGMFDKYNATPAPGIVRLESDGSIDLSFNPGAGAQWTTSATSATRIARVDAVEPLAGGKLLITGDFEAFDGKPLPGIAMLHSNGARDDSFVPPVELQSRYTGFNRLSVTSLPVSQLVPQRDGSALLAGNFALAGTKAIRSVIRLTGFPMTAPLNISTRLNVQTGENVMIGGFIITGTEPKKIIVRALGTSLSQSGVSGALADPTLELLGPDGPIASNDNWKQSQQSEIEATGVAPQSELESAIVRTLAPGAYTAVVRGGNGGTGVGLVELYDLDQTVAARLANISTRGFVQTGENVMIGGFILGGTGMETDILVRALGPSLGDAGVSGALQNPTLELRDNNGDLVAENDNWKSSQETAINATTIPPKRDEEAAILASLRPGAYTAIVRGKDATTGVGLVEVYNVQ